MKIIFLDIDGVLNGTRFFTGRHTLGLQTERYDAFKDDIDIIAMGLIKHICDKTGSKIVISSCWRLGRDTEWFIEGFKWLGWDSFPIIGMTPRLKFPEPRKTIRGDEVDAWLNEQYKTSSEIIKYVIIDDDSDFKHYHMDYFVRTKTSEGITYGDTLKAIEILGEKKDEI